LGGYDSVGRVTSLNHTTPGNSIGTVVTTGYTYDRANNVTSRSQQQYGGGTYGGTWLLDGTYSTGYDDANRILTYLPNGGFQGSYTYDVTGNQTQSVTPVGAHSYSYDGAARLTRADAATMGNDNNGNRVTSDITWEDESGSYTKPVTRQTWDDAGRMASFSRYNSAGTAITYQATYSYNGDGLRTGESGYSAGGGGSPRQFANDLGRKNPVVLLDRTANNAGTFNLWGADGLFGTVTASYNGSWYVVPAYYHHDRQGSTLALTNPSGAITAQYAYDPWGTTSYTWGASVSNQYGGEPKDASGLIYLRARYYEPGTGRFVSADPFGGFAGDPASQNAYAYAGNNPVNRADPSGMSAQSLTSHSCLSFCPDAGGGGGGGGGDIVGALVGAVVTAVGLALSIVVNLKDGRQVTVPDNYVPRPARNGKGTVYQDPDSIDHGSGGDADSIRGMDPTDRYPDGYVVVHGPDGRPVNADGNSDSRDKTHHPIEPGDGGEEAPDGE